MTVWIKPSGLQVTLPFKLLSAGDKGRDSGRQLRHLIWFSFPLIFSNSLTSNVCHYFQKGFEVAYSKTRMQQNHFLKNLERTKPRGRGETIAPGTQGKMIIFEQFGSELSAIKVRRATCRVIYNLSCLTEGSMLVLERHTFLALCTFQCKIFDMVRHWQNGFYLWQQFFEKDIKTSWGYFSVPTVEPKQWQYTLITTLLWKAKITLFSRYAAFMQAQWYFSLHWLTDLLRPPDRGNSFCWWHSFFFA